MVEIPVPMPVEWIDDEPLTIAPAVPAVAPITAALPAVNLTPAPVLAPPPVPVAIEAVPAPAAPSVPAQPAAPAPSPLVFQPSPSLAELLPEGERTSA
jgi:hypothetical protein